jgi:membrane protease YdiL (CAAX protease family)
VVKTSISAPSPLSPTRWPADAFLWWRSLLLFVALIAVPVVATVFAFAIVLMFQLAPLRSLQTLSWPVIIAQFYAYAWVLAVLLPVLPMVAQRSLRELGLRFPRSIDIAIGLSGAIVMIAVTAVVGVAQERFLHLKPDEVAVDWLRAAHGPLLAGFAVLACIAAPVLEEFVFRGFLLNALRRYTPAWVAIAISAILFGAFHMQQGNNGVIVPLAAGGVVLGIVYYWSGSLTASMLTHAFFNAATFFAVGVLHQK